ncbi:copper resistance CopC family protein [Dietzia sp.]|uniref:copper resistance CopC family protein n=1 Tax=Dietzia sp. TaxID=1871616 RepID=UPI002FDA0CED
MRIFSAPRSPGLSRRRIAAPVAALFLAAVPAPAATALLTAPAAQAHSTIVSTSPEQGATVDASPSEVTITFNEDISPEFATLTVMKDGTDEAKGEPKVDGATISVGTDGLEPATYTVGYRAVSADGHPVQGSFEFTVGGDGAGAGSAAGGTTESSSTSSAAAGASGSASPSADSQNGQSSDPATDAQAGETAEQSDSSSPWLAFVIFGVIAVALIAGGFYFLGRQRKQLQEFSGPESGDDSAGNADER